MTTIARRATTALIFVAAWLGLASTASAQLPDIAAGKKRAQVCFACHGENGVSKISGTPHLAGQDRAYLIKAMQAYRNGQRQDPTMVAMVKPLSDTDMVNIATYFHLAVKNARGETLASVIETNERIKPSGERGCGRGACCSGCATIRGRGLQRELRSVPRQRRCRCAQGRRQGCVERPNRARQRQAAGACDQGFKCHARTRGLLRLLR